MVAEYCSCVLCHACVPQVRCWACRSAPRSTCAATTATAQHLEPARTTKARTWCVAAARSLLTATSGPVCCCAEHQQCAWCVPRPMQPTTDPACLPVLSCVRACDQQRRQANGPESAGISSASWNNRSSRHQGWGGEPLMHADGSAVRHSRHALACIVCRVCSWHHAVHTLRRLTPACLLLCAPRSSCCAHSSTARRCLRVRVAGPWVAAGGAAAGPSTAA